MLLVLGIAIQVGLILGLTALGLRLVWCFFAPLLLIILYWLIGLGFIASPACKDVIFCDIGGMLAHTINSGVLLVLAVIIGLCTVLGYIVRQRVQASEAEQ